MRLAPLNLARKPFVNYRPVKRAALVLWLAGAALLAVNLTLFWGHFQGQREQRERLQQIVDRVEENRTQTREFERRIAGLALGAQNQQALFLNSRIARRTFSWSDLFDRLAEVLPAEVQIRQLTPRFGDDKRLGRRRRKLEEHDRVSLEMSGAARDGQVLLGFVDPLFGHPRFQRPNLTAETRDDRGLVQFTLSVDYLPESGSSPATTSGLEDRGEPPQEREAEQSGGEAERQPAAEPEPGPENADAGGQG